MATAQTKMNDEDSARWQTAQESDMNNTFSGQPTSPANEQADTEDSALWENKNFYKNDQEYLEENRPENDSDPAESPLGDSPEATPESTLSTFLAAFQARGRYHLGDLNLDEEYLETFLSNFALRVDGILQKYRAGQLEHGGDIRDRDLRRERSQEIDDLLVYDVVDNTCTAGMNVTLKI